MPSLRISKLVTVCVATLALASCGGSDNDSVTTSSTTLPPYSKEFVDCRTLQGVPEHIDPALVGDRDASQIATALYDGLLDFDYSDRTNPQLKPLIAESWSSNEEASVWTFNLGAGHVFSNGDPVLPSSFAFAWNRAANPDFAADYGYLFSAIKGFDDLQSKKSDTMSGVVANDEEMTLIVTLTGSNADFPSIVTHHIFSPMPEKVVAALSNQADWERGVMIGNGPFEMESPITSTELVLVPNNKWSGNVYGDKSVSLEKLTFKISSDVNAAFAAFESGDCQTSPIPDGRFAELTSKYGHATAPVFGSYHYVFGWNDAVIGGDKNVKLRQAISLAINRDRINTDVYNGSRSTPTGLTPPGIPGYKADLGQYIKYDKVAAQGLLQEWKDQGNSLIEPIKISFNTGSGHEAVVALMQEDLAAIGIATTLDPKDGDDYFKNLAYNGCEQICRAGYFWDYPVYSNGVFDLFDSSAIGANNLGQYSDPTFDSLLTKAIATTDQVERFTIFQQAEYRLLNETVGYLPISWYAGDYLFDDVHFVGFDQTPIGLVNWEKITFR